MLKVVLLLTAFVIGVAFAVEEVPVVLIGAEGPTKPSLPTVRNEEFANIITPLAGDHMIAVIQEEELSVHDFLCKSNRSEQQQSCYAYLQSFSPKTFYRSVESPEKVLEAIDPNYETITISKGGKLETPLKCKAGKVVFLRFSEDDTVISREDTLEAHDYVISNLMKQQVNCPTIYLYTSTPTAAIQEDITAHKRARRALSVGETAAPEGGTIFSTPKFQIFYTTLSIKTGSNTKQITIANMNVAEHNNSDFSVTLTSADAVDTITFDIELVSGYYYVKQLTYNKDNIFRTDSMNAPTEFSYYCGNLTVSSGTGVKLMWNSLQLQAPFKTKVITPAGDKYFKFGESWNCVGFVTPAILAGLFVTAILLAIMFAGICWMLDINTMDRFDDPKGKTITINANE